LATQLKQIKMFSMLLKAKRRQLPRH